MGDLVAFFMLSLAELLFVATGRWLLRTCGIEAGELGAFFAGLTAWAIGLAGLFALMSSLAR
jgi:hypothetical protein